MTDEKPELTVSPFILHPSSFIPPIKVALLGFGNVGRAFARYVRQASNDASRRVRICAVADSSGGVVIHSDEQLADCIAHKDAGGSVREFGCLLDEQSGATTEGRPDMNIARDDTARGSVSDDLTEFINSLSSAGTRVLVESLPTNLADGQPALALIKAALAVGIHVVTVDKGPLAHGFDELQAMARGNNARLAYSGTTGVSVPAEIIGERVLEIRGVLNGTTNYILTEMQERAMSFADALANAQINGIAEPDPSLDVDGWDTAVKTLILAKTLMGATTRLNEVARIGIGAETDSLIEVGRETGRVVRLVGRARIWQGRVRVSVAPKLVGPESPFYAVAGTSKLAVFRTASKGDVTASARSGRDAISQTIVDDIIRVMG